MRTLLLSIVAALPLIASAQAQDDATYAPQARTAFALQPVERQANPYDDAGLNGPEVTAPAPAARPSAQAAYDAAHPCSCC